MARHVRHSKHAASTVLTNVCDNPEITAYRLGITTMMKVTAEESKMLDLYTFFCSVDFWDFV